MVEAEAHSPEMKTSGGTEEIAHNLGQSLAMSA